MTGMLVLRRICFKKTGNAFKYSFQIDRLVKELELEISKEVTLTEGVFR